MKSILLFLSFLLVGLSEASSIKKNLDSQRVSVTKNVNYPCFDLYATGTTANSDEIISIKLTNLPTGSTETYSVLGQGGFVATGAVTCGPFDISITFSVGDIYSAVGIRNLSTGVTWYCQSNICCGDGQVVTIYNVPLSTPFGSAWEVFLVNGSC